MRMVAVPADWWEGWQRPWTLEMLEFYLLSTSATEDRGPIKAGEVLVSLNLLAQKLGQGRSKIQYWLRKLEAGGGSLIQIRKPLDGPTQQGTVYAVELKNRQMGTPADPRPRGPNRPATRPPVRTAKANARQELRGELGGLSAGQVGPVSDRPTTDGQTAQVEVEVAAALGVAVLPAEVAGALGEWSAAGGGLEQMRHVLVRCGALMTRPHPVGYLCTAIRNEIRERPPVDWSPPSPAEKVTRARGRLKTLKEARPDPEPEQVEVEFPPEDAKAAQQWTEVSEHIREAVPDELWWRTWIGPLEGVGWDDGRLVVRAPNLHFVHTLTETDELVEWVASARVALEVPEIEFRPEREAVV